MVIPNFALVTNPDEMKPINWRAPLVQTKHGKCGAHINRKGTLLSSSLKEECSHVGTKTEPIIGGFYSKRELLKPLHQRDSYGFDLFY